MCARSTAAAASASTLFEGQPDLDIPHLVRTLQLCGPHEFSIENIGWSKTQIALLEIFTGTKQAYWRRVENAALRMWAHAKVRRERKQSASKRTSLLLPARPGGFMCESIVRTVVLSAATGRLTSRGARHTSAASAVLSERLLAPRICMVPGTTSRLPLVLGKLMRLAPLLQEPAAGTGSMTTARRSWLEGREEPWMAPGGLRAAEVVDGHPLRVPLDSTRLDHAAWPPVLELLDPTTEPPLAPHLEQQAGAAVGAAMIRSESGIDEVELLLRRLEQSPASLAAAATIAADEQLAETPATAAVPAEKVGAVVVAHQPPMVLQLALAFGSGGAAGLVARAVVHPLDTLRVLQTVSSPAPPSQLLKEVAVEGKPFGSALLQRLYAVSGNARVGVARALRDSSRILRAATQELHLATPQANPLYDTQQLRNSMRILYRGYAVSVLGGAPVMGIYFTAYESAKKVYGPLLARQTDDGGGGGGVALQLTSGFSAECVAATVWLPWEVVRQRMQIAAGPPRGFLQSGRDIVVESGVAGLYTGLAGYMMLWGLFSPLMFVIYEQGMQVVRRNQPTDRDGEPLPPSPVWGFVMGGVGGVVASTLTSPIDVVKTRIQCQTPTSITQYRSMVHGLSEIYTQEGPRALFRGTAARALTMGVSMGILMGCYSWFGGQARRQLGWAEVPRTARRAEARRS